MTKPLNPEKAKKLRPVRIVLAVLIAVLVVLVLDRLPTSVLNRESEQGELDDGPKAPEGFKYYQLYGFYRILEDQTRERLDELGITEEEYDKISEYLSKDEIFELETKAKFASELESVYVEADEAGLEEIRKILNLGSDYSFDEFKQRETAPENYKVLSELIEKYYKTLNTTEDYDVEE